MTTHSLSQQSIQQPPTYPLYSEQHSARATKAIAPRQEVIAARAAGRLDNSLVSIHIDRTERDEREAAMDSYVFEGGFTLPPLMANVVKMLREPRAHIFGLCYEEFGRKAYCRGVEYSDHDLREITEWVQRRKCLAPGHVVHDAVLHAA